MSEELSSFHSRATCDVRRATCAKVSDRRTVPMSLFEEAWMCLGDRLRQGTSHLAPRTSHVSEANHVISEIRHA